MSFLEGIIDTVDNVLCTVVDVVDESIDAVDDFVYNHVTRPVDNVFYDTIGYVNSESTHAKVKFDDFVDYLKKPQKEQKIKVYSEKKEQEEKQEFSWITDMSEYLNQKDKEELEKDKEKLVNEIINNVISGVENKDLTLPEEKEVEDDYVIW